jgi:methylphosphotriester-DNA--protein-cysteine methyltransferase
MIRHIETSDDDLRKKIKQRKIFLGGNRKLKIYGKLSCTSGKRMKRENRVFFSSEHEAIAKDYRPCGHCMQSAYLKWKNEFIQQ